MTKINSLEHLKDVEKYSFVPAYYEWHFIKSDEPEKILLCWGDPAETLFPDDGKQMNDIDEVYDACEDYINTGQMCFEEGEETYNGCTRGDFDELPKNAADIMASALFDYYIA